MLFSSHLLTEVEQICDRVGVIRDGVLVAEGTVDDLRGSELLHVTAYPLDGARRYLSSRPDTQVVDLEDQSIRVRTDRARTAAIARGLVEQGFEVTELTWRRQTLEDVFLGLTGNERTAA